MLPWSVKAMAYMPFFLAFLIKSPIFDIPSSIE